MIVASDTKKRAVANFATASLKKAETKLFAGFIPNCFADESGQAAAIGGFAFESVAGTAGIGEGHAFKNFGFDVRLGFDIIEFVFHCFLSLS